MNTLKILLRIPYVLFIMVIGFGVWTAAITLGINRDNLLYRE